MTQRSAFDRLGADAVVPTTTFVPGAPVDMIAGDALYVVRTAAPAEPPFFGALAGPGASPALARDVVGLFAEAALGATPARFSACAPPGSSPGDMEAALERLALGQKLPPYPERIAYLVERARQKSSGATVLVQVLDPAAQFGLCVTRDLRSGVGPARGQLAPSIRALIEPLRPLRPLAEVEQLGDQHRAALDAMAASIEAELRRPARIAFQIGEQGIRVVAVTPLAHSGKAAVALAVDLVGRGVLGPEEALAIVEPRDLSSALEFRLEPDEAQIVGRGVAAGGGIAIGHACLSTSLAESYAAHRLSPVLFVEELVAEDSHALVASQGVVTVRGGITGEAAIMSRALAKPCVSSGSILTLAGGAAVATNGVRVRAGDRVAVGLIVRGPCKLACDVSPGAQAVLAWTSGRARARVYAVVEHEHDAAAAFELGADAAIVMVPEGLALSCGVDGDDDALTGALERMLAIAGPGRVVMVAVDGAARPLLLPGLTADVVVRVAAEASRRAGRPLPIAGRDGALPIWRPGARDPGGAVIAWTDVATLDQASQRALAGADVDASTGLACAPQLVPAARLALARAGG